MRGVRREVYVQQFIFDLITKLRGPSKSHKDKSRFRVINIPYQTKVIEHNTTHENNSIEKIKIQRNRALNI